MEKISRILPPSERITAVDLSESGPVRGGTPGFGRSSSKIPGQPEQRPHIASSIDSALAAHRELSGWRRKDLEQADKVDRIANQFFVKNVSAPDEVLVTETSEPKFRSTVTIRPITDEPVSDDYSFDGISETGTEDVSEGSAEFNLEDLKYYPKGSFVDFQA